MQRPVAKGWAGITNTVFAHVSWHKPEWLFKVMRKPASAAKDSLWHNRTIAEGNNFEGVAEKQEIQSVPVKRRQSSLFL